MAEVPEHLLERSRERRKALGLPVPGEEGEAPAAAKAPHRPEVVATRLLPPVAAVAAATTRVRATVAARATKVAAAMATVATPEAFLRTCWSARSGAAPR